MKKYIVISCLLVGIMLISAIPFAIHVHADSLDELKIQQEEANSKASSLSLKKEELELALADLNSELYDLTMDMNDTAAQLEECRLLLDQTLEELTLAQEQSADYYESMKQRIRFFYENSSQSVLAAYIKSGNLIDFINSAGMISDLTAYDRQQLQKYQENQQEILAKSKELDALQTQLISQKAQFAQKQLTLLQDIAAQKALVKDTRQSIEDQQQLSEKLQTQIDAMIAYENEVQAQCNPYEDPYYIKTTEGQNTSSDEPFSQSLSQRNGIDYTQEEFEILAALIYCEAGGESYEGDVAVGSVVMNRLRSPQFPDTLLGVIYQHNQFAPVLSGRLAVALEQNLATETCRKAALFTLNGGTSGNWLFFRMDTEHKMQGTHIGTDVFY